MRAIYALGARIGEDYALPRNYTIQGDPGALLLSAPHFILISCLLGALTGSRTLGRHVQNPRSRGEFSINET